MFNFALHVLWGFIIGLFQKFNNEYGHSSYVNVNVFVEADDHVIKKICTTEISTPYLPTLTTVTILFTSLLMYKFQNS